ncbi:MAG: hypothetical protein QOG53_410 [Frankiales bacterium]|jgi:alpha-tubulin suppressor-like RCC1 family protein|nr:hypothetical protein [Frankiales bacterium]
MTTWGAIMRRTMAIRSVPTAVVVVALGAAACSSGGGQPSATARSHVSAVGTVLATGDNNAGQLGSAVAGIVTSLQPVSGMGGRNTLTGVRAIAAGGRHSLAVRADGTVVAWGANDFGQLGTGDRRNSPYPTPVHAADGTPGLLRGVTALASDSNLSLALLSNGHVVTFGSGNLGQRGVGSISAPLTPTTVRDATGDGPLTDVSALAADGSTEMVLLHNGTLVGWGANNHGQLGDGTTTDHSLPVRVRGVGGRGYLTGVVAFALGGQYALAVRADGSVLSWGGNDRGQLGDGTDEPHRFPAPVRGIDGAGFLTGVVEVSAAEKHGFARLSDGRVAGWGSGNAGQLGNNATTNMRVPSLVLDARGEHPLTGVAQIHAGEAYGVAVLEDGTALTWGAGAAGQLGTGSLRARSLPGPLTYRGLPPRNIRLVAPGVRHLLLSADP